MDINSYSTEYEKVIDQLTYFDEILTTKGAVVSIHYEIRNGEFKFS